jgi:ankyrin repeat protein
MECPILVNRPDSTGWSPIHHCVFLEKPSIDVLDALYCAGADVSLFTVYEHYTPLHCLARSSRYSVDQFETDSSLHQFALHLIRDLRAPLSARDKHDETCIHIAAEHGECLELLLTFLECDVTGSVRQMRNDRGCVH